MTQLPYTLYRAEDVRELDRLTIEEYGTPGIELMNRAGRAVFNVLRHSWPESGRVLIICGAGNNGGDGYVIARLAKAKGYDVTLVALTDPANLKGDAQRAWQAASEAGLSPQPWSDIYIKNTDVVIDAIFGTGLDREVEGQWAEVIQTINQSGLPVIAVDIPSGLHADSGNILGCAIQAHTTVTFIGLKQGMFTGDGVDCSGEIVFNDLGVPQDVFKHIKPNIQRIDWQAMKSLLPPRRRNAHKGDHGHVLIVGGNTGMAGAARLAAEAAARTGSGLTTVATRPEHTVAMAAARPEVMWRGVTNAAELRNAMQRATVIAIGPGLGLDEWAVTMFTTALQSNLPLVVDADALTLLAANPVQRDQWILTPHPGEAGRLLGCATSEINLQRFGVSQKLADKYNANIVLKGGGTLVADNTGEISLCNEGNPGMATGGMGDALSGIIAGLLAQGATHQTAAQMGVALHAAAGDKAAINGERGMLVSDLISELRSLLIY